MPEVCLSVLLAIHDPNRGLSAWCPGGSVVLAAGWRGARHGAGRARGPPRPLLMEHLAAAPLCKGGIVPFSSHSLSLWGFHKNQKLQLLLTQPSWFSFTVHLVLNTLHSKGLLHFSLFLVVPSPSSEKRLQMRRSSPPPLTRRWFYVAENTDKTVTLYIASCSKACLRLLVYIHQVSQHLQTIIRLRF